MSGQLACSSLFVSTSFFTVLPAFFSGNFSLTIASEGAVFRLDRFAGDAFLALADVVGAVRRAVFLGFSSAVFRIVVVSCTGLPVLVVLRRRLGLASAVCSGSSVADLFMAESVDLVKISTAVGSRGLDFSSTFFIFNARDSGVSICSAVCCVACDLSGSLTACFAGVSLIGRVAAICSRVAVFSRAGSRRPVVTGLMIPMLSSAILALAAESLASGEFWFLAAGSSSLAAAAFFSAWSLLWRGAVALASDCGSFRSASWNNGSLAS